MPDGRDQPVLRLADGVAKVDAAAWDACAGGANPSLSHDFLTAMEDSRSVGKGTGWFPRPLLLESADGRLLGAVPLYIKGHSYGEYVFDHGWANAYERAGGRYYPKLLAGVPFTPGSEAALNRGRLAEGLVAATRQLGVSSLHVNFVDTADAKALSAAGLMERVSTQYHWNNAGYKTFADFLASLASRKRKMIRKERESATRNGLVLRRLTGAELTPAHWQAFFRFYIDTSDRKWGSAYLTREFFLNIGRTMADRVLLVMAEQDGVPVAGAFNLIGRDTLYGRNWGSDGAHRFLHFEACYYQTIEFAIERGLARVEAGAQGEHTIDRGYLPVETRSFHYVLNRNFASAVADFLRREKAAVEAERSELAEFSPFRRADC